MLDEKDPLRRLLRETYRIPSNLIEIIDQAENAIQEEFALIDGRSAYNQLRLLHIFQENGITDFHLNGSTGYGYGDAGRDALERVYADYFGCGAALVRSQIVSGTHALAIGLYGNLKPGDEMISAAGSPYDTLQKIIGLRGERDSLMESGVTYREIPIKVSHDAHGDNCGDKEEGVIDLPRLLQAVNDKTKLIFLQRSKGYQWRHSLTVAELEKVISAVKAKKADAICLVDNCYCEMTEIREPGETGADLVIGSLIKNPGGTLAPCGGYIAGGKDYVEACGRRLLAPGLHTDLGASLGFSRLAYQGLFQAPQTVCQSVKGAVLAAAFFQRLGYEVMPEAAGAGTSADSKEADADWRRADRARADIVQAIKLGDERKLARFCEAIQRACPVGASFVPEPAELPGYSHPVIMAGGGFIQGSSSELSADGPLRPPYIAYLQGGFSLAQIRLGLLLAAAALALN